MYVLGVHLGHDASACLIRDGQIVADVQEERFSRIKHQYGVPLRSISFCLDAEDIEMADLDGIAFSSETPNPIHEEIFGINLASASKKGLRGAKRHIKEILGGAAQGGHEAPVYWKRFDVSKKTQVFFVEHHLAHAASAYYSSGINEKTIVVTADGRGDDSSLTIWKGEAGTLEPLLKVGPEGSLGWFYGNVTEALGWWHGDGEGKTMGLAPYGDASKCQGLLGKFHPKYKNGQLDDPCQFGEISTWTQGGAHEWHFQDAIEINELVQEHGRENIAAEAQRVLEEQMKEAILPWLAKEQTDSLCCSGGVFLNVKLNQRFWYSGKIGQHYIFPNCGDAGLAAGAALYGHQKLMPSAHNDRMPHLRWGPQYTDSEVKQRLEDNGLAYRKVDDVSAWAARILADGKILGWFQGRMESGPRALGGRSILMSAARAENKDIINAKVKFREGFRPFCPSLTAEAAPSYFSKYRPENFMITSFDAASDKRERIPAVVHVDGTVRPQAVERAVHQDYWELINTFGEMTGDPVVINTSFNIRGEPIVCTPGDAIRCFFDSGIDALAIGSYVIEK